MEIINYSKLMIVGNGFDINLGFKSGYNDFVDSDDFLKLISDKNELAIHLKEKRKEQNWIDIENELKIYAQSHPDKPNYSNDFVNLKKALLNYLSIIKRTTEIDTNSLAYDMFTKNAGKSLILDFNYTESTKDILKSLGMQSKEINLRVVNIHGTLKTSNIVFGVEDYADIGDHIFLKKTFTKNYSFVDVEEFLNSSKEIIVFGHSIGETDHPYFTDFFENIILNKDEFPERKNMHLYHYGEDERDKLMRQINTLSNGRLREFRKIVNIQEIDSSS